RRARNPALLRSGRQCLYHQAGGLRGLRQRHPPVGTVLFGDAGSGDRIGQMSHSHAKILYVDDDPALGRLVQKVLGRQGRDIIHVTSAAAGLERLAEGDIDVLVLDHYLADGTGLALLEQVAAREDAPPAVYVTASTEAAVAVAALKAGAADYVLKTVGEDFLELLSSAVEQAIQTARLHKAREMAEREMREARERAELALAEGNHRGANALAVGAAPGRLQRSAVADP